jgi:hypothetical protein
MKGGSEGAAPPQKPKVEVLANIGRTGVLGSYAALHLMRGSGHGAHCAAGQAGHAFGSGHFTTGQRGRGQGGHSPILQGFEHVEIQGGHCGTLLFSTYLLISGSGGHSVFSIYLLISGIGGQGGTVAFSTHLLGSGSLQGGQLGGIPGRGRGHSQRGRDLLQRPQGS